MSMQFKIADFGLFDFRQPKVRALLEETMRTIKKNTNYVHSIRIYNDIVMVDYYFGITVQTIDIVGDITTIISYLTVATNSLIEFVGFCNDKEADKIITEMAHKYCDSYIKHAPQLPLFEYTPKLEDLPDWFRFGLKYD